MSVAAKLAVWKYYPKQPAQVKKLILLALANNAGDDMAIRIRDTESFFAHLSWMCNLSQKSCHTYIDNLAADGALKIELDDTLMTITLTIGGEKNE